MKNKEITVVKEFTFESAHRLPEYKGKCRNIHGHSYKLLVGYKGPINEDTGMVIDFSIVKKIVEEEIVDVLDHKMLNDVKDVSGESFPYKCPTAENMIRWIVIKLRDEGKMPSIFVNLEFIRLYETETSYAEWRKEC